MNIIVSMMVMVLSGQQCPAGDQEGVGLVQWRCHETHQDMVTGTVKTPGDHDWWVLSWSRQHGSVILMKDKKQTLSVMKVTKELCCLSVCQTTVCMNSHICGCVLRTFHNYASNNVCMCESIKKECAIRLPKYRFYSYRFCFFRSCILPCQLELVLV